MLPAHPPLLTRLRHRLRGFCVLFALLLLVKVTVATACAIDDVPSVDPERSALSHVAADAGDAAETGSGCWHEAFGGCHCSCSHTTMFPAFLPHFAGLSLAVEPPRAAVPHAPKGSPDSPFRPPVA